MFDQIGSYVYMSVRFLIKWAVFSSQLVCFKKRDLESVVHLGHRLLRLGVAMRLPWFTRVRPLHAEHAVQVYDLTFPSPVTVAAYESNLELLTWFLRLGVGGVCYKTMMPEVRQGNQRPRLLECTVQGKASLINAMGLPGPGAAKAIAALLQSELLSFKRPIGLSLGGESYEAYLETFQIYQSAIEHYDYPFYYEINISCPNTSSGKNLGDDVPLLEKLVSTIRTFSSRVISVKLSPDQDNQRLLDIGNMLTRYDKCMITMGNTQFRSCDSVGLAKTAIPRGGGGLSGPVLLERTLACIKLLHPLGLPLIATGGIASCEDVQRCQLAGATLVGVATAMVHDPFFVTAYSESF